MESEKAALEYLDRQLSGRQIRPANAKKVKHVISQLMAKRGYAQTKSNGKLTALWQSAAGSLGESSRAVSVERGTLRVIVKDSMALQELKFKEHQLIARIQQTNEGQRIKKISFQVGRL